MSEQQQIGIIHEIGDMGLGYQELTEAEKKQLEQNKETKQSK